MHPGPLALELMVLDEPFEDKRTDPSPRYTAGNPLTPSGPRGHWLLSKSVFSAQLQQMRLSVWMLVK